MCSSLSVISALWKDKVSGLVTEGRQHRIPCSFSTGLWTLAELAAAIMSKWCLWSQSKSTELGCSFYCGFKSRIIWQGRQSAGIEKNKQSFERNVELGDWENCLPTSSLRMVLSVWTVCCWAESFLTCFPNSSWVECSSPGHLFCWLLHLKYWEHLLALDDCKPQRTA